ncbi:DUF3306 domain-containing protein [Azohydromonas sediminis]|uniref:DUF3306 domain-containing protein n=1 Tax=Azohydromonas sediminis TaxID=2259674 RepID=UPI000E650666|nr:DUF3306 domain-containing protein [Azohydromonas sediminis]
MADDRDDGFFSRWARRKAQARRGTVDDAPPGTPPAAAPAAPAAAVAGTATPPAPAAPPAPSAPRAPDAAPAPAAPPLPTMDDVARLTRSSDFSPFVRAGVDEGVKRAALKKLFSDPHFNVMDGLDVYIDDYGQPDPLPASMLRKMVQSKALGLFTDEPPAPAAARATAPDAADVPPAADVPAVTDSAPAPEAAAEAPTDEDADLRLQPLDAAGRGGDPRDAGDDAGRER